MMTQRIKSVGFKIYNRFIRLKGAPRSIALGFSLGVFVGMTPFIGAHLITSVILASLFGWNKISAALGVNVTNLGTAPLIYPINYWVGLKLAGLSSGVEWSLPLSCSQMFKMMEQSPLILVDLFIGGVILGIPLAFAGYFISLKAIYVYRHHIARHPKSKPKAVRKN